jgi:membrane-bound ClpP family serine protease
MTIFGIILIILAGLVLFLLELLVIPGITVAGVGALVLMGIAVFLAFSSYGTTTGFLFLTGVLIAMGITLLLTFRSKTWNRVSLKAEVNSKVNETSRQKVSVGDEGVTVTRLNPVGTVQIGDERFEGHSEGPFVDHRKKVVVIRIEPTYVVVKPIND